MIKTTKEQIKKPTNLLYGGRTPYGILMLFFLLCTTFGVAQEFRVIDNKGTIRTVTSNSVTTATTAPTSPVEGDVWFDTTTNNSKIYDGSNWLIIDDDAVTVGTTAPTTPVQGDVWFDTTNDITKIYDGSAWQDTQASSALALWDKDTNTGIQVEESADENKIRFDTAGTERMIIHETGDVEVGAEEVTPTGTAQEIVTNDEAFSNTNFAYYNATLDTRYGANSSLFDDDTEEGPGSYHANRTTAGQDWGFGYTFNTTYYITSVRIQAQSGTGNWNLRTGGGEFRLYNGGTLVYTSSIIAAASAPSGWTTAAVPNVVADEVRYIFPNGADTSHGAGVFNACEFEIEGQAYTTATQSLLYADSSTIFLGVGTNSPTQRLDVNGRARVRTLDVGAATDEVVVADTDGVLKKRSLTDVVQEPWFGDDDDAAATTNTEDIYHMGNVGIGVNDPSEKLHINGGEATTVAISDNANTGNNLGLAMYHGGASGKGMGLTWNDVINSNVGGLIVQIINNTGGFVSNHTTFTRDGNLGIGLTNPDKKLDVNGEARVRTLNAGVVGTDEVVVADTDGVLKKIPASNLNNDWKLLGNSGTTAGTNFLGTTDAQDLVFKTNNIEAARFKSGDQRFLFANPGDFATPGVSSSAVLGIDGTTHSRLRITAGDDESYDDSKGASIDLHGNNATANTGVLDLVAGSAASGTNSAIKFWTNTDGSTQQTSAVITGDGDMGIGTTAPAKKLHVEGTARITDVPDGSTSDNVLVLNADGDILKISPSDLPTGSEPWFGDDDDAAATTNTEDIYHMGNVGIGETTPTAKLHVKAALASVPTKGLVRLGGDVDYSAQTNNVLLSVAPGVVEVDAPGTAGGRFKIASNGNVGIGITAPVSKFHVYENTTSTNDTAGLTIEQDGTGDAITQYLLKGEQRWITGIDNSDANKFKWASSIDLNSNTRMTLTTTGNLGIGTVNPDELIHTFSNVTQGSLSTSGQMSLNDGNANLILERRHATINQGGGFAGPLIDFRINNPSNERWSVAQIMGLADAGGPGYSGGLAFLTQDGSSSDLSSDSRTRGNHLETRMIIQGDGDIGIGTAAPTQKLDVDGDARIRGLGAGAVQSDANGNLSVSSDERLKNITGSFGRGLDAILELNPISYKWNKTSEMEMENTYTGFSAQNVQQSIPEAVSTDDRGYLTLSDRPITAALVNSVKELKAQNDTLKAENKELKARLEKIEKVLGLEEE